ncbi:MAG: hypothetical protein U1D41_15760 [Nitrosomonas sp.]|uniref:hypothetical protein n=1 Tax=Nitrosomonas sp. TaxID=42353 RepID=UPI002732E300|nr:hypothetical protein [Nitrosomonas sp.]MDP3281920.1 hypothetical protein [Nitrosomonas sp.]MDP3661853.1 hypothetical protein [Nitrosomonas sp.]MDZ4107580.1 hypothetical protein [Nitrosomonas sp.]
MPIRQGSIDGLCGVYSVMNATEVVIGKFHYDRRLKRKASQRRVLFKNLIGYLAKNGLLEETLICGFEDIDVKGGFIDIAIKSVKKYQKRKLRKQIAFDTDDVTLDQYWEKLTEHLSQPDSAVIISLSGRIKHWTCVRRITPNALILSDSSGIRQIARNLCSIDMESRDMYTLWPMLTYLLLVERKMG